MSRNHDCANCGEVTSRRYLCKACRKDRNPENKKPWTCMYPGRDDDLFTDTWESLDHANAAAREMIAQGKAVTGAVFIGNTLHAEYGSTITVDVIYKQGA